jgi:hypothetical protein
MLTLYKRTNLYTYNRHIQHCNSENCGPGRTRLKLFLRRINNICHLYILFKKVVDDAWNYVCPTRTKFKLTELPEIFIFEWNDKYASEFRINCYGSRVESRSIWYFVKCSDLFFLTTSLHVQSSQMDDLISKMQYLWLFFPLIVYISQNKSDVVITVNSVYSHSL